MVNVIKERTGHGHERDRYNTDGLKACSELLADIRGLAPLIKSNHSGHENCSSKIIRSILTQVAVLGLRARPV
jgi:hypothetical protein